jgi:hypothetical protein
VWSLTKVIKNLKDKSGLAKKDRKSYAPKNMRALEFPLGARVTGLADA